MGFRPNVGNESVAHGTGHSENQALWPKLGQDFDLLHADQSLTGAAFINACLARTLQADRQTTATIPHARRTTFMQCRDLYPIGAVRFHREVGLGHSDKGCSDTFSDL